MFALTFLEKNQRKKIKVFSRKWHSIIKNGNFNSQEARVKVTNTQLNKLKSSAKNKRRIILRSNKKNFQDEE